MLARHIAPIALLLLAGCSSSFEPGEDLSSAPVNPAAEGSQEQSDGDPLPRGCNTTPRPQSAGIISCIR